MRTFKQDLVTTRVYFVLLSSVPPMVNVSKDLNNAQGNASDYKYLQQCERAIVMLMSTNTTDSKVKTFKRNILGKVNCFSALGATGYLGTVIWFFYFAILSRQMKC